MELAPGGAMNMSEQPANMARVMDEDPDGFRLEYDNTLGKKNVMRLEAFTYEQAVCEAKSFLGINAEDRDMDGTLWDIE
jgi:hypothetical protein